MKTQKGTHKETLTLVTRSGSKICNRMLDSKHSKSCSRTVFISAKTGLRYEALHIRGNACELLPLVMKPVPLN